MNEPDLVDLIRELTSVMSVTGFTLRGTGRLYELIGDFFDEKSTDRMGNHLFVKRCGRENAPKILLDAHFDEIGMMVTSVKEGGFLTVTGIGGVDTRILQGSEVTVYGRSPDGEERRIYGVVGSTPPHLQKPGEADRNREIKDLLIDTGLSADGLRRFAPPGTPVGFRPVFAELRNGIITGKGFDDKACGACIAAAVAGVRAEDLWGDVYFLFSNFEEDGASFGGAATGAFAIDPDVALAADVTFASSPDTKKRETCELGKGVTVTLSPMTDVRLSKLLMSLAAEKGIGVHPSVATRHTGTDAYVINKARAGIPTLDIGLPLRSMHTSAELASVSDCEALRDIVRLFITEPAFGKELENV
jgi:endoglucanase